VPMLEGEGHGRPVVRNSPGILFQASPCQTVGVINRKSLPSCDQSNFGQLVKILQGFFRRIFSFILASGGLSLPLLLPLLMLMRQGLKGLRRSDLDEYHLKPNNVFLWRRNKTIVPANKYQAVRILGSDID
jgi:hypothetical protein